MRYFWPFLHIVTFLYSSLSWEPFSCLTSVFFISSCYYTEGYLTKKNFSQLLSVCWKPFWSILRQVLGYSSLFLGASCSFLHYCDNHFAKKNFATLIPLLGVLSSIFGPVLGALLNVLKNVKLLLIFCTDLFILLKWSLN